MEDEEEEDEADDNFSEIAVFISGRYSQGSNRNKSNCRLSLKEGAWANRSKKTERDQSIEKTRFIVTLFDFILFCHDWRHDWKGNENCFYGKVWSYRKWLASPLQDSLEWGKLFVTLRVASRSHSIPYNLQVDFIPLSSVFAKSPAMSTAIEGAYTERAK
ncbi:hypothetical protein PV326_009533 [Microctonus aethiopoides]|nr:hypothetical protein PV326_009533 [Microctonus aethiopoides]